MALGIQRPPHLQSNSLEAVEVPAGALRGPFGHTLDAIRPTAENTSLWRLLRRLASGFTFLMSCLALLHGAIDGVLP